MNTKSVLTSLGLSYARCARLRTFKVWSPHCLPIVPFKLSDIGEGIREVTVKQSFIKPNQRVNQFEEVLEVESDKAVVTITSRYDGEVRKIYFKEGDIVPVGAILCEIHVEDESTTDVEVIVEGETVTPPSTQTEPAIIRETVQVDLSSDVSRNKALATPAVRRLARENNLDLSTIRGSGKNGRVMKEDILVHLNQPSSEPFAPVFRETDEVSRPLAGYQKVMVRTMTESNRIPALGLCDEIDVTELEALRRVLKTQLDDGGVKVTLLAFIAKAISLALNKYPILNAVFENGDAIKYQSAHNIGIAVDTTIGLVVPNIKNVQNLSVREVAGEVQRVTKASAEGKLSLADTSGGTFTISNIGAIAGTVAKPLILPPQVAIVAIGRVQALPRFDGDDQLRKRLLVNASWAADHRVIDGATVARFSNLVKRYLENPGLLAVDA